LVVSAASINDSLFESLVRDVMRDLKRRFGMEQWILARFVDDEWVSVFAEGDGMAEGHTMLWEDSMCAVMLQGEPSFVPDLAKYPAYLAVPASTDHAAYAGVPVYGDDGAFFGTLCAFNRQPVDFDPDVESAMSLYSRMLSAVLSLDQRSQQALAMARYARSVSLRDGLTEVLNRRGWEIAMAAENERCRRYGNRATIVMVDVDGLKELNDTEGHAAGDVLLKTVGSLMLEWTRSSDTVARLGGDEFGALLIQTREQNATTAVDRLRRALSEAGVDVSIGVADNRGRSLREAANLADERMYEDKRSRRSQGDVAVAETC
jgi:diguanylate cyclase (GGDEF)-like protein